MGYVFAPFAAVDDLQVYEALARANFKPSDVTSAAQLKKGLKDGTMQAWWLKSGEEIAGWMGIGPSPYLPGAVHLYGGFILPAWRGKGLSHLLWQERINHFGHGPLTVSIQPDNAVSLRLAARYGFVELNRKAPWVNFVRCPQ